MKESFSKENITHNSKESKNEALPDDHWFSVTQKLYESMGEKPSPLQIRAKLIVDALKLPSGQTSALDTDTDGNRTSPEKDKVIAELLTNKAGVMIDEGTGIVSMDPRDIYPDGLPSELEKALDPRTAGIINTMYKSEASTYEKFGDTEDDKKAENLFNYFRLPGGIDLLLMGYMHNKDWHRNHQEFLAKIGRFNPAVIGIEGFADISSGESLEKRWGDDKSQQKHYDKLMKQLVENGFTGLFTEVDVRDISKISMDGESVSFLPEKFFKKYFAFLKREEPWFADILEREQPWFSRTFGSPEGLRSALQKQAAVDEGLDTREKIQYKKGMRNYTFPYLKENGDVSTVPTGLEMGGLLFSDALAAIKLHMTARLMADGYIPKGPIVDFEGDNHLPSKMFFIRNPEYTMLLVLRIVNELMVGVVKEEGNIEEIYNVFDNPNWTEVVKEIAKLHFSKVDTTKGSSVEVGNDQYPINKAPIDFLKIYNINPEEVIPNDKEIKSIIQKLK